VNLRHRFRVEFEISKHLAVARVGVILGKDSVVASAFAELEPFSALSAVIYAACIALLFDFSRRVFKKP